MAIVHSITLWKDGQFWSSGFLSEFHGEITLYPCVPGGPKYDAATLPEGVKVCPSLTHGQVFAPKWAQDSTKAAALRYGYEIFEIDIVPW